MNSPQHHKANIGATHGGMGSRRPSERAGLVRYTKLARLKPHPLNEKLYGAETVDAELIESIRLHGVLEPKGHGPVHAVGSDCEMHFGRSFHEWRDDSP